MMIELHPHQEEAIHKMHNGCVLWGGVGTGKTIAALAYCLKKVPDTQIVVITTAKKRDSLDWTREAAMLGIHPNDIQVTSWNKINEFVDYVDHMFIFDEQRLVGTGAWVKSFYKIAKQNQWILLSATPGDTWSDYAPMFIANGWYKNITEFRREHAVYSRYTNFPKIERYIGQGKLQKYRKHLLVEMPMARHTTRHMNYIECEYNKDQLDYVRKKRWNIFTDEPIKNAAELFGVMRKIVSSDPSRVSALKELMNSHDKLIVFYNYNYELDILRDLLSSHVSKTEETPLTGSSESKNTTNMRIFEAEYEESLSTDILSGRKEALTSTPKSLENSGEKQTQSNLTDRPEGNSFAIAEWNGHKHEPIPTTDKWVYLVQYLSGSEGWNCVETDAMVFWSLTYSWKQFEQAQGRIDRLNTKFTDLHYYVLMTNSMAEKPVIRSLQMKKDFQPKG